MFLHCKVITEVRVYCWFVGCWKYYFDFFTMLPSNEIPTPPRPKSSQVFTLPKAKSQTRSKQNTDMRKYSSVYSERGVPLPVLTSGGE